MNQFFAGVYWVLKKTTMEGSGFLGQRCSWGRSCFDIFRSYISGIYVLCCVSSLDCTWIGFSFWVVTQSVVVALVSYQVQVLIWISVQGGPYHFYLELQPVEMAKNQ